MSIRLLEESCTESVNGEKIIEISEAGGNLNVQVTLKIDQNVTLTENAPAFWRINFCGKHYPIAIKFYVIPVLGSNSNSFRRKSAEITRL